MVKVKKEVKMDLGKLITWAKNNNITVESYESDLGETVDFDEFGDIIFSNNRIEMGSRFNVTVEEEITEDTEIYRLLELRDALFFKDGGWEDFDILKSYMYGNKSISQAKHVGSKKFYMLNDDDTMTLIWKDGELL